MGHTKLFIKRIGLAYALYFVLRLLYYLFHLDALGEIGFGEVAHAFWVGLMFDSSAIVYGFSPFILMSLLPLKARGKDWYQKTLKFLYLLCAFVAIVLSVIDFEYAKFTGKRSGIEFFATTTDEGNNLGAYFKDYWYLGILMLLLLYLVYRVYPKWKAQKEESLAKASIALLVFAVLGLLGARGGIGLKPIKSFSAATYVDSELVQLTINTPFNFISTAEGDVLKPIDWLPTEVVHQTVDPIKNYYNPSKKSKNPNVVLLILESFGREYVGHLGGEKPCTPFLDSLSKREDCISLTNFYSNGNVSMDAVPSLISGIPGWMDVSFSNSIYQTNAVENLGASLTKMGYTSKFYHGSKTGTMGFSNFLNMGGMSQYYGIENYPKAERDFDGNWGIFDEPYLQYVAQEIDQSSKPSFTTVFTLSSHHPYSIPDHLSDTFMKYEDKISRSVAYGDYAVSQFFKSIEGKPWFQNTVFLITADHASFSKNKYYNKAPGRYEIPMLIYSPGQQFVVDESIPCAHKDVLPTVLDLVNYPDSFYSLGSSVLRDTSERQVILFLNGLYWIGDGTTWLTMTQAGKFNSYFTQERGEKNKVYLNGDARMNEWLKTLQAYVQEFNQGVMSNQMKKK